MSQSASDKNVRDTRVLPYQKEREPYSVRARCGNCGWEGTLLIAKGDKAPGVGFGISKGYCDTCGCRDVVTVR